MRNPDDAGRGRYRDLLEEYRGARVFFDNLPFGNNGDLLIEMGSRHIHQHVGLRYVDAPRDADLLLLRGNGSFLEDDPAVLNILLRYAREHADIPLCVEPSTFTYTETRLAQLIPPREAPLYLFARDELSFGYLLGQRGETIQVGLDHDLALSLRDSTIIERLRLMSPDKILIVERMDIEHPFRSKASYKTALSAYRSILPKRAREKVTPILNRVRSRAPSRIKKEAAHVIDKLFPELSELPRISEDVGDRTTHDFDSFLSAIGSSAAVITSRLHPGILAAMLGKPTVLITGDYPKIRAVYEHSLSGFPNVFIHSLST